MKKLIWTLVFLSFSSIAGLPPTSTKGTGDSSYLTTFKFNFGNIPLTHNGTTATVGTIPISAGGTGATTRGFVLLSGDTMTGDLTVANTVKITKGTGSGANNLFMGPNTGTTTTTGYSNTGFGDRAAGAVTGGASVTAFGHEALGFATTGDASSAFGAGAGRSQILGNSNAYFGVNAGYTNSNGQNNVCMGNGCLYNNTGSRNTGIGHQAGVQTTGSGGLFLGYNAGYNATSSSNQLWIANTDTGAGSNLITGDFALGKVGINVDPNNISNSAILQLDSTTQAFLPPRLTTTQQNAVATPLNGSLLYNSSTAKMSYYDGSWRGLVDNSSNETIAGTKTFSSTISGSINGNASTVTTNANLSGDVTSVGNVASISNSVVTGKTLTGFTSGAGTVSSSDSILTAIQKLDGNDSLAIPNSTVTTKGDLIVATQSSTVLRLAAGTTNQALIVDSTTATGLKWGTVSVAGGGTGLTALTSGGVLIGNGTSTPTFVSAATNGNVLISNGTTWTSAAPGTGTSQVLTPSTTNPVIYSAKMSTSRVVSNEKGDFISGNCTNANPSVCTFTAGAFDGSTAPNCTVTGGPACLALWKITTTATDATVQNDAGACDFVLSCHGNK